MTTPVVHWAVEGRHFRIYEGGVLFQEFGDDPQQLWALAFLLLKGAVEIVKENGHCLLIEAERQRALMARDILAVWIDSLA